MNWEAIGAISEFVGAFVVLVTVIYLAVQVRHLKQQNIESANMSGFDAILQIHMQTATDIELSELIVKAFSGEELTPAETVRLRNYIGANVQLIQRMYYAHLSGVFDKSRWEDTKNLMRRYAAFETARQMFLEYVEDLDPSFRKEVHDVLGDA